MFSKAGTVEKTLNDPMKFSLVSIVFGMADTMFWRYMICQKQQQSISEIRLLIIIGNSYLMRLKLLSTNAANLSTVVCSAISV